MTVMTINKLPSKTWYWLKVNETKLPWDFEHTTELSEENISAGQEETARFSITGEGEYSSKKINIHAAKGEATTVFMDYAPTGKIAVYTNLTLEEDAHIRLIQLQHSAAINPLVAHRAHSGKNEQRTEQNRHNTFHSELLPRLS